MAYRETKKEHAFQAFHKSLKNNAFSPVIFMYGEEEYLTEWACKSLADKFVDKNMRDMDFVKMDEDEGADDLLEYCNTFSVFSEKRVVWAYNFTPLIKKTGKGFGEKEISKIIEYIENPNPQTILIFSCVAPEEGSPLVKALKKKSSIFLFDQLDRPQLMAFAEKRFKAGGVSISRETLKYLIDETGYFHRETDYKIFNLENDIKKLIALSSDNVVTDKDIDDTVHGDMDSFVFDFLDAAMSNKKDTALRILYNMLGSGSEAYGVLGLLVNQFELMLSAKEIYDTVTKDKQKVADILKMNAYRVKKALSVAEKFSTAKLKMLLSQLYEIDRGIKTGDIEQTLALELFIGRI